MVPSALTLRRPPFPSAVQIVFRRRYFCRKHQLQSSLVSFLEFYNFHRLHQGFRTKGRTPSQIFWRAVREHHSEEA